MKRFVFLLSLALAACGGTPTAQVNVGSVAPAFETTRTDGKVERFPTSYAGQPVVLRFWADWCKYCEGEMKAIEPVYRAVHPQGLQILAINAGQDKTSVDAFMSKLGVSYPALLDAEASIAKRYGVVGLPTTFFVDGQGVVRGKIVGEADAATFERHVRALLP